LETVLVSAQNRSMVPNAPYAQKLIWMHSMVLQGDKAELEARFSPSIDSANLDAR
jgi:hypothetical protein